MPERGRNGSGNRSSLERTAYEPRLALRRIESALLALGVIAVVGVPGYMALEDWSVSDAL